jgi:hypothetical protein
VTTKPTADDVTRAVIRETQQCLDDCVGKIEHCLDQISVEQVWWRPHESMNSIGNLLLHLTGNVRQWVVAGLGGAADIRDRPHEFAETGPIPKDNLLGQLKEAVNNAKIVFSQTTTEEMLSERCIQGFDVTGWGAIFSSVPHFKGHTQEIICLTRMQLGETYKFHWQPKTPEEGAALDDGEVAS